MKNVRTVLLAAALFVSAAAMAQYDDRGPGRGQRGQGGPGQRERMTVAQRAERETSRLLQTIEDLSDQQIGDIYVINLKYATADSVRMDEMRAQRDRGERPQEGDFEAMRKQMQERQEAKTAEIRAVLNADQQAKYDALLKQMAERRGQGGPGRGQGRPPRGEGGPQGGPDGFGD